jgi:hypothetical protein
MSGSTWNWQIEALPGSLVEGSSRLLDKVLLTEMICFVERWITQP